MRGRLTLIAVLAACSEVQPVQLGAPASRDAGLMPPMMDDSGVDTRELDAGPLAPPPAQPGAADAGAKMADTPDARSDDKDIDDDADEDTDEDDGDAGD